MLKAEWYENLEEFSYEVRDFDKKLLTFAPTTKHKEPNGKHPVPTLAILRLQMYSNLAYGAQGLQYFTYWTPRDNAYWDFQHAPIGLDRKRTEVYDLVKEMNEEINRISGVFLGVKVLSPYDIWEILSLEKRKGLPYFPKK